MDVCSAGPEGQLREIFQSTWGRSHMYSCACEGRDRGRRGRGLGGGGGEGGGFLISLACFSELRCCAINGTIFVYVILICFSPEQTLHIWTCLKTSFSPVGTW